MWLYRAIHLFCLISIYHAMMPPQTHSIVHRRESTDTQTQQQSRSEESIMKMVSNGMNGMSGNFMQFGGGNGGGGSWSSWSSGGSGGGSSYSTHGNGGGTNTISNTINKIIHNGGKGGGSWSSSTSSGGSGSHGMPKGGTYIFLNGKKYLIQSDARGRYLMQDGRRLDVQNAGGTSFIMLDGKRYTIGGTSGSYQKIQGGGGGTYITLNGHRYLIENGAGGRYIRHNGQKVNIIDSGSGSYIILDGKRYMIGGASRSGGQHIIMRPGQSIVIQPGKHTNIQGSIKSGSTRSERRPEQHAQRPDRGRRRIDTPQVQISLEIIRGQRKTLPRPVRSFHQWIADYVNYAVQKCRQELDLCSKKFDGMYDEYSEITVHFNQLSNQLWQEKQRCQSQPSRGGGNCDKSRGNDDQLRKAEGEIRNLQAEIRHLKQQINYYQNKGGPKPAQQQGSADCEKRLRGCEDARRIEVPQLDKAERQLKDCQRTKDDCLRRKCPNGQAQAPQAPQKKCDGCQQYQMSLQYCERDKNQYKQLCGSYDECRRRISDTQRRCSNPPPNQGQGQCNTYITQINSFKLEITKIKSEMTLVQNHYNIMKEQTQKRCGNQMWFVQITKCWKTTITMNKKIVTMTTVIQSNCKTQMPAPTISYLTQINTLRSKMIQIEGQLNDCVKKDCNRPCDPQSCTQSQSRCPPCSSNVEIYIRAPDNVQLSMRKLNSPLPRGASTSGDCRLPYHPPRR